MGQIKDTDGYYDLSPDKLQVVDGWTLGVPAALNEYGEPCKEGETPASYVWDGQGISGYVVRTNATAVDGEGKPDPTFTPTEPDVKTVVATFQRVAETLYGRGWEATVNEADAAGFPVNQLAVMVYPASVAIPFAVSSPGVYKARLAEALWTPTQVAWELALWAEGIPLDKFTLDASWSDMVRSSGRSDVGGIPISTGGETIDFSVGEIIPVATTGQWVQPTGAHDAYQLDDEVTYDGFTWRSTINANVWAPGVYGWVKI